MCSAGLAFSFTSTLICGGLVPGIIMLAFEFGNRCFFACTSNPTTAPHNNSSLAVCCAARKESPIHVTPPLIARGVLQDPSARPLHGWRLIIGGVVFLCAFWGYKGIEVDLFYQLQAKWFGDGADAGTIVMKVFIDQFVYNPIWAVHSGAIPFLWKDCGFSFA